MQYICFSQSHGNNCIRIRIFLLDDFENIEDFEDTKVIENIINKLYDEDNETNGQRINICMDNKDII